MKTSIGAVSNLQKNNSKQRPISIVKYGLKRLKIMANCLPSLLTGYRRNCGLSETFLLQDSKDRSRVSKPKQNPAETKNSSRSGLLVRRNDHFSSQSREGRLCVLFSLGLLNKGLSVLFLRNTIISRKDIVVVR